MATIVSVDQSANVDQIVSARAVGRPRVARVATSVAVDQNASVDRAASVPHASAKQFKQLKTLYKL